MSLDDRLYIEKSLNDHAPYVCNGCPKFHHKCMIAHGEKILKALQLKPINPDEVNLTPELIRFNK